MAVVLSGGGAKGAYEAGALVSLAQTIDKIDVITGASIGAINAALFAWEYEKSGDMLWAAKAVKATWSELGRLFKFSFWHLVKGMLFAFLQTCSPFNFTSLVDTALIKEKLQRLIPPRLYISDITRLELAINATCLSTGKTVTFNRNNDIPLWEAALASSSIPILFASRYIGGAYYVDGGIFNNTPLKDAIATQASDIFVVELKPKSKDLYMETIGEKSDFKGAYRVGARLMELIFDKIMYEDLKKAKKTNEIIEVIKALEASGPNRELLEQLKTSIGYEKDGQVKRYINFYEIAPSQRLEPPGTLGFRNKKAIENIIKLGEKDARQQLASFSC